MRELILRKCESCGAVVKVIKDCHCKCGFMCCGDHMEVVEANSVDAAFEKHIPNYEIKDGKLEVRVNHVMEDEHYIEWIALVDDDSEEYIYFKPGEEAVVTFDKTKGILYSYCNQHGLWKNEIK